MLDEMAHQKRSKELVVGASLSRVQVPYRCTIKGAYNVVDTTMVRFPGNLTFLVIIFGSMCLIFSSPTTLFFSYALGKIACILGGWSKCRGGVNEWKVSTRVNF